MPTGDFNIGRDVKITVISPVTNLPLDFDIVTSFDKKSEAAEVKVKGMDGIVRHAYLPDGWKGTIEVDRASDVVDSHFAALEEAYYNGVTILNGSILETIVERGGLISQYRYEEVAMKLSDAGKSEGDKPIKMKIDFGASRRKKVA